MLLARQNEKIQRFVQNSYILQQTFTCSKSTIETFKKRYEICSNFDIKTLERRHWRCISVFVLILNVFHTFFLVLLLLTLKRRMFTRTFTLWNEISTAGISYIQRWTKHLDTFSRFGFPLNRWNGTRLLSP